MMISYDGRFGTTTFPTLRFVRRQLVGLSFVSSRPSPQHAVRTHRAYRDIGLGECFWVIGHVPTPEPSPVCKLYELTPRNCVAGKPAKRSVLKHGFDV